MTNQELIQKIKELKQIKPSQNWVILTKKQILDSNVDSVDIRCPHYQISFVSVLRYMLRPKTLVPITVTLAIAIFTLGQFSLPGEQLYPVKKITETGQENLLVSDEDKSEFYLNLAEKRAGELKEIASANQVEKLSPAIKEYQASLKNAVDNLDARPNEPEQTIDMAKKMVFLEEKNQELEQELNIEFEEFGELKEKTLASLKGEIENIKNELAGLVKREIQNLENSSLTESQQTLLEEIKRLEQEGDFATAWEKIFLLSY